MLTGTDLVETLRQARWFGGKSRDIASATIIDRADLAGASICFLDVRYAQGSPETYVIAERLDAPEVGRALLRRFGGARIATETGGGVVFRPTSILAEIPQEQTEPIVLLGREQSNTSIRFGDALILKLFRRIQYGPNPDVEVGRYLTEQTNFRGTPAVAGSIEYETGDGQSAALALLQRFEPNRGDAWHTLLQRLDRILEGGPADESLQALAQLGQTTADLHVALAEGDGEFLAEPISFDDVADWRAAIESEVRQAYEALQRRGIALNLEMLLTRVAGIDGLEGSLKIRHHGDYHLGQVLERTDGSFAIIDFEGEPAKPLALRREKRSPLRDVAGLLRSLDYARHAALRHAASAPDRAAASAPDRVRRAADWHAAARQAFLERYLAEVQHGAPGLLPLGIEPPLAALELEKAAYEVLYELNNRPDWLPIPLAALR